MAQIHVPNIKSSATKYLYSVVKSFFKMSCGLKMGILRNMKSFKFTMIVLSSLYVAATWADPCPSEIRYSNGNYMKYGNDLRYSNGNYLKYGADLRYPNGNYLKYGSDLRYSNGNYLKYGTDLRYPNGNYLKYGNDLRYSNGNYLKYGNDFRYPNGNYARYGDTLRRPDGTTTEFPVMLQTEIGDMGTLEVTVTKFSVDYRFRFTNEIINELGVQVKIKGLTEFLSDSSNNQLGYEIRVNSGLPNENIVFTMNENGDLTCEYGGGGRDRDRDRDPREDLIIDSPVALVKVKVKGNNDAAKIKRAIENALAEL